MDNAAVIVAISTSVQPAGRLIVRLSGHAAHELATRLINTPLPGAGVPARASAQVNDLRIPCTVYAFYTPRSYTGEDVVELHLPGSALIGRLVVDALVALGARPAEPGEYTARAFFNGRLDLTRAEAVATLVQARNEDELRAARQLMAGELAHRLTPAMDALANALALLEVGIDFSDEDVTFISTTDLEQRIDDTQHQLTRLLHESVRFERLSHEPSVVLTGRPNAGKSTLLNALAGVERAVVSDVAGTTRDVLSATIALPGGLVALIDAAGVDDAPLSDASPIEQAMHRHALRAIEQADVVALVIAADDPRAPFSPPRTPDVVIHTKADISPAQHPLAVSAVTGQGMQRLRDVLNGLCFSQRDTGTTLALNQRHVHAIDAARDALQSARDQLAADALPIELIAADLREALDALGSILGTVTPDDVLGRIFSAFCIGK